MDESLDLGFEEQILEPQPEEEPEALVRAFATVGEVYADGLSLIFDGETEPTEKHYLCNTNVFFQAGDRVRILADSGTYVVEYVVGPPKQARTVGIPAGGSENQVLTKAADADFAAIWKAVPHEIPASGTVGYVLTKTSDGFSWQAVPIELPSGGSDGQVLTKNGTANYAVKWAEPPSEIPASGTTGYVLTKTASGVSWQAVPIELPSGGSDGQVLTKNGTANYAVKWAEPPSEIPASGTVGYVLTKTASGFGWAAVPTEIPASGTTGYVLTKTNNGFTWQAITVPSPLWIPNPAYSANPSSSSYVIQFRTANYYGDGAKQLQFRVGSSGSWITLATA